MSTDETTVSYIRHVPTTKDRKQTVGSLVSESGLSRHQTANLDTTTSPAYTSTEVYCAWCRGYGEGLQTYAPAYDALKAFPLPMQSLTAEENYRRVLDWLYSGHPNVAALIIETQTGTSV